MFPIRHKAKTSYPLMSLIDSFKPLFYSGALECSRTSWILPIYTFKFCNDSAESSLKEMKHFTSASLMATCDTSVCRFESQFITCLVRLL